MVIGNLRPINIEEEMRSSYLDYAMSVIVARALPDVRDGLKPVHRRILYAMDGLGLAHNSAYKKSARIVGEVLGKYHPHGDSSVYDAMVRMAQDFSMRHMLVDGQGNFGSMDNDPPAAMRYTEARLSQIAEEMLVDLDKDTVDFMPNFDDSLKEPVVLPTKLPNLLVNGTSGIAVGMATNIPPHNLGEICDAIAFLIDNPEATVDEVAQYVKGPDFPTAGIIMGAEGIKNAYATGHGRIVVRARSNVIDAPGGHKHIIFTELPYQTNKAALVEKIAELVKDKKITGISDLRDESDRHGLRVVIELRREAQPEQVLNSLYKYTAMQSVFFVNMLALVDNQPRVISLKEALAYFIDFRRVVITRRSRFELAAAKARAHILEGLKIALDHIDEVIATIRQAENVETARQNLMSKFSLSQEQAQAILDMQLRRLANLERQKILDEYAEIVRKIAYLEELLSNPRRIDLLIKEDSVALKKQYADKRRTEINVEEAKEYSHEELIPHQDVAVTLSNRGFIKRVPSRVYKLQNRGGKGIIGMVTREADVVGMMTIADTHDNMLFFTNRGKVFSLKCYEVPADLTRTAKGTSVVNLFPITEGERVTAMMSVTEFKPETYMIMATRRGEVKKTSLDKFAAVRRNGLIAMDLEKGDELVAVSQAAPSDDIIMVTRRGQSIRFPVASLRVASRTSGGVRGIRLQVGDEVVSTDTARPDAYFLLVSSGGYGKLTAVDRYPRQNRGGKGVRTFKLNDKTGELTAVRMVALTEEAMIISAEGIVTRISIGGKDKQGVVFRSRDTQGVRLMRLNEGDRVVAVSAFE